VERGRLAHITVIDVLCHRILLFLAYENSLENSDIR
jgi:hypothetical protein